jgi:hypothetical protein
MSESGQSRRFHDIREESALPPTPDILRCLIEPRPLKTGALNGYIRRERASDPAVEGIGRITQPLGWFEVGAGRPWQKQTAPTHRHATPFKRADPNY